MRFPTVRLPHSCPRAHSSQFSKAILADMMTECQTYIGAAFLDALKTRFEQILGKGDAWGRERHRLFVYEDYLAILNEGTEPIR